MLFLEKLKSGCKYCDLSPQKVLIGLSGGADSVALSRGLLAVQTDLGLELVAAHLNHQLRSDDSRRDEAWVTQFCERHDISLVTKTAPVEQTALSSGNGIEETARNLRYEFLKQTAKEQNCSAIVVGHHANDQIETVLHHLLRGTGLQGLAGMPWSRPLQPDLHLVRPLLEITRDEINQFLQELSQDFVQDESNRDTRYTRNRIRHELIPLLKSEYSPNIEETVLNLSRQASEIQSVIESQAQDLLKQVLLEATENSVRIDKPVLAGHPRHLIREVFVQLWRQNDWPRGRMTFEHWGRLAGIILGEHEGTSLPGPFIAKRIRKELHIERLDLNHKETKAQRK